MKIKLFCAQCKKEFYIYPYRIKTAKFCSKRCGCLTKRGNFHNHWKGGRNLMKNGYIRIRINGSYIYEHRHIMEKFLKRSLNKFEHIHHLNNNKTDNRLENLQLINKRDHDKNETIKRWQKNPESFRSPKQHCLQPRTERHGKGKLCQLYTPCRFHFKLNNVK